MAHGIGDFRVNSQILPLRTHPHADYIDSRDFPRGWLGMDCTVEVEAKAKELAVLRLAR